MRIISFDLGKSTLTGADANDRGGFFTSANWFSYYFSRWPDSEKFGFLVESYYHSKSLVADRDSNDLAIYTHIAGLAMTEERTLFGLSLHCLHWNYSPSLERSGIALELNTLRIGATNNSAQNACDLLLQLDNLCEWDELRVPVLQFAQAIALANEAKKLGFWAYCYGHNLTYLVNLQSIQNKFDGNVLASLSANSRAQLRKARRLITAALGPIIAAEPQDKEELCRWFADMALLHEQRWQGKNKNASGFALKAFKEFYLNLALSLFELGQLQFLRCTAGESTIGFLFNIVNDNKIEFLMSGVNYQLDSRFKPGMLCHLIAIERGLAKGYQSYDLLMGTSRYKQSLATHTEKVISLKIRKKKLRYWPEHWIRQLQVNKSLSSILSEHDSERFF